jgi:hypothetical protein
MSIGAFNYQTSESTLLGSVDQLRIRADNGLYNYLPVLSGPDMDLGVPVRAAYMSGLGGYASKLNANLREINAMNPALLAAQKRDPDNSDEKITIKDITNAGRFVMFGRAPGKREVGVKITATVTFNRFEEGTFKDTNEDFTKSVQVYLPMDLAQRAREEYDDSPTDAAFNLVRERGASLTDQEINLEVARAKKQAGMSAEANRRAAEEPATNITPAVRERRGRDSAERRARNAVGLVEYEGAAERNKSASARYKWGVDLSVYNGGPGDVRLARDAANFQKQAKLTSDGIIGPKTLEAVKAIRLRVIAEGRGAKVPVEILPFVNALKIPGLADPRTEGAVDQAKFEQLKTEGVVKEQAKPSEVIQQFGKKYPEQAKATGLVLPTKNKAATPPAPRRRPRPRPKTPETPAAGATLTQDQLSAAQRGNIASSKSFGWRTNPGVYPEGPGSALLAEDIAFIQRKFSIGGSPGVMTKSIIDRIQNQQLSGLGAVQADSVSTLDVVSRLLSGVVFGDTSNINWWYVGGAGLAVAAALAAVALTSKKA